MPPKYPKGFRQLKREVDFHNRLIENHERNNRQLRQTDEEHNNHEHARQHIEKIDPERRSIPFFSSKPTIHISRARTLSHYHDIHTILDALAKHDLRGKKVLHVAASTGVYARFLEEKQGAMAIALDLDPESTREAKNRGTKNVVRGSAVPTRKEAGYVQRPSGLFVPHYEVTHVPIRDKSMDFIVSDHFLFSNYHREIHNQPGFEHEIDSIKQSVEALNEMNRILKKGGRLIAGNIHGDIPALQEFQPRKVIHGMMVEYLLNENLQPVQDMRECDHIVFRKVRDYQPD